MLICRCHISYEHKIGKGQVLGRHIACELWVDHPPAREKTPSAEVGRARERAGIEDPWLLPGQKKSPARWNAPVRLWYGVGEPYVCSYPRHILWEII